MKKTIEAELKDLAKKILEDDQESSVLKLKQQAKGLYEKLTVLAFTEENLASFSNPSEKEEEITTPAEIVTEKEEPVQEEKATEESESVQEEEEKDEYLPDGTEYNESAITEPNTEKIKDIVAQMPPETSRMDTMLEHIISQQPVEEQQKAPEKPAEKSKPEFRNVGVDYDNLPDFEPVKRQGQDRPKSLNDRLKKGMNIGLNDRLAFIKHLFDGKTADYNRVISQLNTFDSVEEAEKFIQMVVKPDYKYWVGKEEYEEKFMRRVENKFSK